MVLGVRDYLLSPLAVGNVSVGSPSSLGVFAAGCFDVWHYCLFNRREFNHSTGPINANDCRRVFRTLYQTDEEYPADRHNCGSNDRRDYGAEIHTRSNGWFCGMLDDISADLIACRVLPCLFQAISSAIISAAALTYPIFLVHHKLISLMVKGFDLAHFTYRYVLVLFVIYFVLAVLIAKMLKRTTSAAMNVIKQRRASCSEQHSDG